MKSSIYFISLFSILILGCQNEHLEISPVDALKKMSNLKTQIFNLDTISSKTIKGESGTIIFFDRQQFDIPNNAKITLNLTEYDNFKDLVLNNIQTVTKDDKLLESSGVFKIEFLADGKPVNLKKGEYLEVYIPQDKMRGNILFTGVIDSLGNMKWDEIKNEPIVFEKSYTVVKRGVFVTLRGIDTLAWTYPNQNFNETDTIDNLDFPVDKNLNYLIDNFDWINCDHYIEDFEIKLKELILTDASHKIVNVYILYHGQNSFYLDSFYYEKNYKMEIQYLPKKTFAVVVSYKNGNLYADKFEITDQDTYQINLKKTDQNKLFQLMELE
jgi:hypothetical protein